MSTNLKSIWLQFLKDEKTLGFKKAKEKYLKEFRKLDIYALEKKNIKQNIDKKLKEHNEMLREIGAKEINFNLKEENIEKLVNKSKEQTISKLEQSGSIEELKSIHSRGVVISTGSRVQEVSSYINLLLNNEIRNIANNNVNSFAQDQNLKVIVVNSIHVKNEKCDSHIGKFYNPDDDSNLPLYHPNCKCTTSVVFDEKEAKKNATLLSGKKAEEYEKLRSSNVRYERLIRQKRRLGEDTKKLRKSQKQVQNQLDELVDSQAHLTKKQKQNLGFAL